MPPLSTLFLGPITGPERPAPAVWSLVVLTDDGDPDWSVSFQFLPERLADDQPPEWNNKLYPGGSHPLKQFGGGGDRVISLPLVWYCEDLPADLFGRKLPISKLIEESDYAVNAMARASIMRGLSMGRWDAQNGMMKCPPYCVLVCPGVAMDLVLGQESLPVFVTNAPFEITSCFPSGIPRVIKQELTLSHRIQGPDIVSAPIGCGIYLNGDDVTIKQNAFWSAVDSGGGDMPLT